MAIQVIADGIYLDTLAPVAGLSWSETCPGGMASASWSMASLPAHFTHPCLRRGKQVQIKDGPTLLGTLIMAEPDRSTWSFNATGLMVEAANYPCVASDGAGGVIRPLSPDAAVDYAISVGLPWTRPTSLGAAFTTTGSTQISTLADLLAAVCARDGTQWMLSAVGAVSVITPPAAADAPSWVLTPGSAQMAVADDDYYSDLYGLFLLDTNFGTTTAPNIRTQTMVAHVSNAAAAARFGVRMKVIDLTALGSQILIDPATGAVLNGSDSTTNATAWKTSMGLNLQARLAQTGGRLSFTNTLDVLPYQLVSPGGVPAHLPYVRPAQKVRMFGVSDSNGNATPGLYTDLTVAKVDHSAVEPVVTLTPTGFVPRNLDAVLADAVAASDTKAA